MPVFNVSFLNSSLRSSGGGGTKVGILTDQLAIMENELSKDGLLSAGDYDLLIAKAREIRNIPSLTADQRSNLDVRISGYDKSKQVASLERAEDLSEMKRTLDSEAAEDVMIVGNNPELFLQGRIASLQGYLNELTDAIERRDAAGLDTTQHLNDYQEALRQYTERVDVLDAIKSNPDPTQPLSGYAAYVKTNNQGEIVDIDYTRYGNKSGYVETNGLMNGIKVYGKVNTKEDGKNYFILGNEIFSAVDSMIPDAENPGSFKPTRLISSNLQTGSDLNKQGLQGYVNLDANTVAVQSYIPRNSWARGVDGQAYFRREDGGYTKYININQSMEGRPDPKDMLRIPTGLERNLQLVSDETVDEMAPMVPSQGSLGPVPDQMGETAMDTNQGFTGFSSTLPQGAFQQRAQQVTQTPRTARTSKPMEQASQSISATAQRTNQSGRNFLSTVAGSR